MVPDIVILTARQRYNLGDVEAMDLLRHVRSDGGEHRSEATRPLIAAINGGRAEVRWSEEAKGSALGAINAWLMTDGADVIPEVVMSLRDELVRDLRIAPFEDDSPTTA